jgi:hypothetical protein
MDATIDASGSNGEHGSSGFNGFHGGDAEPAGRGSNGGRIVVTLSSISDEPGHVNISGTIYYSDGNMEDIDNDYRLGKTGLIHFISRGGKGGNGGLGGNGQGMFKLLLSIIFIVVNLFINNYLFII